MDKKGFRLALGNAGRKIFYDFSLPFGKKILPL